MNIIYGFVQRQVGNFRSHICFYIYSTLKNASWRYHKNEKNLIESLESKLWPAFSGRNVWHTNVQELLIQLSYLNFF